MYVSILCKSTIMLIKMHLIYRSVCIRMGLNCICPSPDLTDRTPFGIALGYPGLSQHYIFVLFCLDSSHTLGSPIAVETEICWSFNLL